MNTVGWILLGMLLGYMLGSLLTVRKKINVTVKKQKVKGKGNLLDSDFDVVVEEKKERKRLFNGRIRNKLFNKKQE